MGRTEGKEGGVSEASKYDAGRLRMICEVALQNSAPDDQWVKIWADQVLAMIADLTRYKAALEFYADVAHWIDGITTEGTTAADNDCGTKAREALAGGKS